MAPRPPDLTEADVVRQCDQLARAMGFVVVNFSQSRASRITEGVPDRRYRNPRIVFAFWFEAKAPGGKLTREQYQFLKEELACGSVAGCGGLDELKALLDAAKFLGSDPIDLATQQVDTLAARGFRGKRKEAA